MEGGQDSAWVAGAVVIGLLIYFGLIGSLWKRTFRKKGTDEPDNSGKPAKKGRAK